MSASVSTCSVGEALLPSVLSKEGAPLCSSTCRSAAGSLGSGASAPRHCCPSGEQQSGNSENCLSPFVSS